MPPAHSWFGRLADGSPGRPERRWIARGSVAGRRHWTLVAWPGSSACPRAVGGIRVPSCGGTVKVLVVQPVGMLMCRGNLPHVGKRGCRPGDVCGCPVRVTYFPNKCGLMWLRQQLVRLLVRRGGLRLTRIAGWGWCGTGAGGVRGVRRVRVGLCGVWSSDLVHGGGGSLVAGVAGRGPVSGGVGGPG